MLNLRVQQHVLPDVWMEHFDNDILGSINSKARKLCSVHLRYTSATNWHGIDIFQSNISVTGCQTSIYPKQALNFCKRVLERVWFRIALQTAKLHGDDGGKQVVTARRPLPEFDGSRAEELKR